MNRILLTCVLLGANFIIAQERGLPPSPPYYQVRYAASADTNELRLGVSYTLWIPPTTKVLRGIIVHQHGCGEPACKAGATSPYDLHWQSLARKWDCGLLGPSYEQAEKDNCAWWCDPRNGSELTFLRALTDLGVASGHPELQRAPWALWGHSGGANWAGIMLLLHPERVLAVWLRSGSPGLIPADARGRSLDWTSAALAVPVMCNVGEKEKEGRFARVWETSLAFFRESRSKGGLVGFAPDPRTSHECGDSRYLAIPWFDACLAVRLSQSPNDQPAAAPFLEPWLAAMPGNSAQMASAFRGDLAQSVWLPNRAMAFAWSEYVRTGAVTDSTPPPPPTNVRVSASGEILWEAAADFESGIAGFIIERDGTELARLPAKSSSPFGRPLFQRMSYHDTPELPLPVMRYSDDSGKTNSSRTYRVRTINSVGLSSLPEGPTPP